MVDLASEALVAYYENLAQTAPRFAGQPRWAPYILDKMVAAEIMVDARDEGIFELNVEDEARRLFAELEDFEYVCLVQVNGGISVRGIPKPCPPVLPASLASSLAMSLRVSQESNPIDSEDYGVICSMVCDTLIRFNPALIRSEFLFRCGLETG